MRHLQEPTPSMSPGERMLFDRLADPCLAFSPASGCIVDANPAAGRLLGAEPAELRGRLLLSLAAPDPAGGAAPEPWAALAQGAGEAALDLRLRGLHGRQHAVSACCTPLDDGTVLVVLRDIDRHLQAQAAMVERMRQWRQLASEAMLAQGRERERIAAGLHDEIGQTLAMVGFMLGELDVRCGLEGPTRELIGQVRDLVGQAARATRTATFELSCPLLGQLGLRAAIESVAVRVEADGMLDVRVEGDDAVPALPEPVPGVVYRVVRELLLNVRKHARATHAWVRMGTAGDEFHIEVRDDGIGFAVPAPGRRRFSADGGYGLVSAQVQVQAVGGRLTLESSPGQGTRVLLALPLPPAPARERASTAAGPARQGAAPASAPAFVETLR